MHFKLDLKEKKTSMKKKEKKVVKMALFCKKQTKTKSDLYLALFLLLFWRKEGVCVCSIYG